MDSILEDGGGKVTEDLLYTRCIRDKRQRGQYMLNHAPKQIRLPEKPRIWTQAWQRTTIPQS